MSSIPYYNTNSKNFIEATFTADMFLFYDEFTQLLPKNASILDIGCGSGRDSLWFINHGYKVMAHDGAEEMVKHCQLLIGASVIHATFEEFWTESKFDGLWACASLLHVPREELVSLVNKYATFLKDKGVFFMSFKLREVDHEKDGRIFTNFTEKSIEKLIEQCKGLTIVKVIKSVDVREGREDEEWLSVIVTKEHNTEKGEGND